MSSKKVLVLALAIVASMSLACLMPIEPVMAAGRKGPRTEYLLMKFFTNPEECYTQLKLGNIDLMLWPLTKDQYQDAIEDPNIILGPVTENGMYEFDLNCNETIDTYPGVISPTSQPAFRRALALLTDKWYVVQSIAGGFATRMDVPVVVNAPSWINTSCVYPNFDWEYDPTRAAEILDAAGFVMGPNGVRVYPTNVTVHDAPHVGEDVTGPPYVWTLGLPAIKIERVMGVLEGGHWYTNLEYTFDPGTNNVIVGGVTLEECTYLWIEYRTPHSKAGEDLDPIIFYARSDHLLRLKAGEMLKAEMKDIGIPVAFYALPSGGCYPPVMGERNYHIYTGGWRLGRFPTSLFFLYHSIWWMPWGYNYVNPPVPRPAGAVISAIDPNLDVALRDIYYAKNIPEAIVAAKKAQGIYEGLVPNIPLCASKSFFAWRSWLLGVCNMMAYGPENTYTFMNAYKATTSPEPNTIRAGWNQPPLALNILFSSWVYDYAVLDRMFEGGQAVNPYDLATDQAWIVQDWGVDSWVDPEDDLTKTKVTYWIRKDVHWTNWDGSYKRQFTVDDIIFSNMFVYAFDDGWHWDNVMDIHHIRKVDDLCFEIYFVDESYWFQYAGNYPYLPKDEWLAIFGTQTIYTEAGANYGPCDHLIIPDLPVAWVEYVKVDGTFLQPGVDYDVEFTKIGTQYCANDIHFLTSVSGNLEIKYWQITGDPHGYFPGSDTDWQSTFYSIGPYNMIEYVMNEYALLKRNPYYFLETPPLGEIDWMWWWGDLDSSRPAPQHPEGPRTGYFLIDIYDVTFANIAYDNQGMWEPDPLWVPGADLAPSYTTPYPEYGGLIDIYDVTTVNINYDTQFGTTPLDP
ncbi:MAG: ABC transporter substrate-binding protein [Candidatus Bathyarchaeia archaeon]|jgi:ABC-type transport system substrate-binding protein